MTTGLEISSTRPAQFSSTVETGSAGVARRRSEGRTLLRFRTTA